MGFIKRRTGTTRPPDRIEPYDFCLGDPALRSAYERFRSGDVNGIDAFVDSRPDDWLILHALTDAASGITVDQFRSWAEANPTGRSLGWLGKAQVVQAWSIRGTASAENVPANAWDPFREALQQAEATLSAGVSIGPGSADPWIGLITAGLGLGRNLDDIGRYFNEAQRRAPFRPDGCHAMLQALCAKWGGSDEEMFDFARWVDLEAPASSAARSVLPLAHLEHVMGGAAGAETPSTYLARPDVSTELRTAARRFLDATPANAQSQHLLCLNYYAMTLTPVDVETARLVEECIDRIADRPTAAPWNRFGNVTEIYQSISQKVVRRAQTFRT